MSVELSQEIWNELRRYVNTVDRDEAAETLVAVLIDNDVSADEIKSVFKTDSEVKRALASYLKDHEEELDDYDDDEDDEDDEDDNY
jgi:predicted transcriptional regulator